MKLCNNINSWNIAEKYPLLSRPVTVSKVIKTTDTACGLLGYRSKLAVTPNNNGSEKMEPKEGSVRRPTELPLLPICPLRTCFWYTLRWLMIHVAFCTGCEHSAVNMLSRDLPQSCLDLAVFLHRFRDTLKLHKNYLPNHLYRFCSLSCTPPESTLIAYRRR